MSMFLFYLLGQPQAPNAYGGDNTMFNPQPTTATDAFFSPQKAFYPPSNQAMPGMEFLENNQLLNVGLNVVEKGMKDVTRKTVNMLPNEVKTKEKFLFF
jgi:hypothetical protein